MTRAGVRPRLSPTTRSGLSTALVVGCAVLALKLFLMLLDAVDLYSFSTPLPATLLGLVIGMTYGLLAVGLVLVYRTNRIINFAHGQVGAFAAAVVGLLTVRYGFPYWIAFPLGLMVGGATGAAAEAGVVRRLRKAPKLMSVVATLGVGQFLVLFAVVINGQASVGASYPSPPGLPTFTVGTLVITPAYSGMLLLSPIVVIAIAVFLARSRYGLGVRAAASNPEAARMAGVPASRMSSLAWAMAGALSAFSAILTQPTLGFGSGDTFGPSLLLRAMAGAVLARMESLPRAMAAGIGLGVTEQLLLWNHPRSGFVEVSLFVIIVGSLLLQRQRVGRDEEKGSWAAVEALRPLPAAVRQLWLVRHCGHIAAGLALLAFLLLPLLISNTSAVTMTSIMGFAIVGLAVGLLTGLGGQLTLGQFAVGGIGAVVSWYVSTRTGNFPMALLYAGLVSAAVSVLIGLPSLRVRGLTLTLTTLSFALVTPSFLLSKLLGTGQQPGRPIVFGQPLDSGKEYYYFALLLLVLCLLLSWNVRRSGLGRLLVAVRDNEDNARAFTVVAWRVKVQGFLLAGFIAGIGGATVGHAANEIGTGTFPARASIDIVVMTVVGGVSVLIGPLLGAFLVIGIPSFLPLDSAGLAATQFGLLLLILYLPGGLAQLAGPIRGWVARLAARLAGLDYAALVTEEPEQRALTPPALTTARPAAAVPLQRRAPVLLEARDLRKHFGGIRAVDGVSFDVRRGETLGLIGPNGAGKTTTFELLGGFTSIDAGRVLYDGRDVTSLGPEARGRLGLIRSFQDAALFPTMTVLDCIALAHERTSPTSFVTAVAGFTRSDRRKLAAAQDLAASMGLEGYADKQIRELSTGTRRIVEIACLVALDPVLLLLDEPSSGIAQRETEALGGLLENLKKQLGLTLVVIEHDIPLIMALSDRIVAMADGRVISSGTPAHVRDDPAVVDAYLGTSAAALQRSGAEGALVEALR